MTYRFSPNYKYTASGIKAGYYAPKHMQTHQNKWKLLSRILKHNSVQHMQRIHKSAEQQLPMTQNA